MSARVYQSWTSLLTPLRLSQVEISVSSQGLLFSDGFYFQFQELELELSNLQCSIHCSIKSSAYCNFISTIKKKHFICDCIEFPLRGMGFSLVSVSRGCSPLQCVGFSWQWLLLWSMDSESTGSVFVAHGLSCSVSCRIWDRTCVSCIGSQILYHWATREAREHTFFFKHQKYFVLVYSWLTMLW